MNIVTKAQLARLPHSDFDLWIKATNAGHAINDTLNDWGNMTTAQRSERADRLRALADLIDGRTTAGGNENTYSY
mgnify:CR=1 FL=1